MGFVYAASWKWQLKEALEQNNSQGLRAEIINSSTSSRALEEGFELIG